MANNSPAVVLIIILLFLFFTPNSQQPSLGHDTILHDAVAKERAALVVLNNGTEPDDFDPQGGHYLNLTGFRKKDGYGWSLLPHVKTRVQQQLDYAWGARVLDDLDALANKSLNVYHNVTGWARGTWIRSELGAKMPAPKLNLSKIAPDASFYDYPTFQRNITGQRGNVRLFLHQDDTKTEYWNNTSVSQISVVMTIQDESSYGDGWEFKLFGIQLQNLGAAILTTSSDKFEGIFALPNLALTTDVYQAAQHLLNVTLTRKIMEQESDEDEDIRPWDSTLGKAYEATTVPQCEFIVYLQQHPLTDLNSKDATVEKSSAVELLEEELRFPIGGVSHKIPPIHMSMLAWSPDCNFVLESLGPPDYPAEEGFHLQGPKAEQYIATVKYMLLLFNIVLALQAFLLIRQMKEASTPSTRSRISFYTMAMHSLGDAFTWVVFLTIAFFIDAVFVNMIIVAFFAFLSGSFFGMKFLMDIWNVQEPERQERSRRQQRQANSNVNENDSSTQTGHQETLPPTSTEQTLPLPVTATRPIDTGATPIIILPDQDFAADTTTDTPPPTQPSRPSFGSLYTRIYLLLLFLIFLSLNALNSWPPALRSLYTNTLATIYLSYWVPQIHRNIIRNCRRALSWPFVFGQSVLRLLPVIYFWGFPENVLFVDPDRRVLLALVGWVWAQCLVLVGQEVLGPRFCVSEKWKWIPAAWEYHPILREDEEGVTLPLGAAQTPLSATTDDAAQFGAPAVSGGEGEAKQSGTGKGKKVFDCAICQQDIEVAVVPVGGGSGDEASSMGSFLARRAYMVTPCRHIFHSPCLEGWMRYRLQCPICREGLPPL